MALVTQDAPEDAPESAALDELDVGILEDCTGRPRQECLGALQFCRGSFDAAALQLLSTDMSDLLDFRAKWFAEIDVQNTPALTSSASAAPDQSSHTRLSCAEDSRRAELCYAGPPLPRTCVREVCTRGLLEDTDYRALWTTCRTNAAAALYFLSGRPWSGRSSLPLRALQFLAAHDYPLALAVRRVCVNDTACGRRLAAWSCNFDLLGGMRNHLVSLDVECWSFLDMQRAFPQLVALRFLRMRSVASQNFFPEQIIESGGLAWPQALRAAAVPGQLLAHMRGTPPKRLLVFFLGKTDSGPDELQGLRFAVDTGLVEELHLIDTLPRGCLTLKGLFGKGGAIRDAPLRRFLLFREKFSSLFEGFFCALKVALPCIEEVYAAYRGVLLQDELENFLQARQSTLRRLAIPQQANLPQAVTIAGKSAQTDLRLDLPCEYDHALTRPLGISDWAWTSFGAGSPLCPRSASQPLSYSQSFWVYPQQQGHQPGRMG